MQHYQHPPSAPQFSGFHRQDDEIDLFELFNVLWVNKVKIIAISIVFSLCAIVYSLTAQQWWTSKAIVIPPQISDYSAYQYQVRQFQPVFDIYQQDGTVLVSQDLEPLVDNDQLFKQFINSFNSLANKKAFLLSNDDFKSYLQQNKIAEPEAISRTLDSWFVKIKAVPSDKKRQDIYSISLQATTDKSSYEMLTSYIAFVSKQVFSDNMADLKAVTFAKENELKQMLTIFESQAESYIDVEKQRSKLSLEIAKAANLDQPIANISDNKLFDIQLGSSALEAKVKALDSINNLGVVDPNIQQIQAKLQLIRNTKIDVNIKFKTFRFLENVEMPMGRDKPKRALIVVLGTLLGGMLGVAWVLIQHAFSKRKEEK
ncbi:hypothetical protein A3K86_13130 [Photobacterium jeanii]|uniref:Chain-length determining protein n=2 Tax=Photobacterium jeanii TaxID=858640 RepID=A0A178KAT1_9GAMM|nr:hypothetical protein A3K86_13130 [Photobacterium jeanii]PST88895.1 LPS chain length-determining protein [Photobacterium jeanii]